jgi:hypothetical protein
MRVLNQEELDLVRLGVLEGIIVLQSHIRIDFKVKDSDLTVHQKHRLEQIEGLLYTLFCEVVEENGVLQSEYDV